jgi:hypothetical protein
MHGTGGKADGFNRMSATPNLFTRRGQEPPFPNNRLHGNARKRQERADQAHQEGTGPEEHPVDPKDLLFVVAGLAFGH